MPSQTERGELLLCPSCSKPVIVKKGVKVIWHFAHKSRESTCQHQGESLRHMEMKDVLCKAMSDYEPDLEVGIGDRIADVVIKSKFIVYECQASSIGIPEYIKRTQDYASHGYECRFVWDSGYAFNVTKLAGAPVEVRIKECPFYDWNRRKQLLIIDKNNIACVVDFGKPITRYYEYYTSEGELMEREYDPVRTLPLMVKKVYNDGNT